jgi:uncharacterized protein YjdB
MIMSKQNLRRGMISGFSFFIIIPLLIFLGCSREVSWIQIEPKSVELNKKGETFQIKAVPLDKENKPIPDAKLIWESSNPEVASVDENGLLTAKSSGNTTITAIAENGEKAVIQCKVSILAAIKVEPKELKLKVGEKAQMEATVLNDKGELFEDQNVSWASSDQSIAFIDDIGRVTAVAPGEVTVTATTPSKGLTHVYGTAKITVIPAEQKM